MSPSGGVVNHHALTPAALSITPNNTSITMAESAHSLTSRVLEHRICVIFASMALNRGLFRKGGAQMFHFRRLVD